MAKDKPHFVNTFDPPLAPRNNPAKALLICRYSDCPSQTEASNDAQELVCKEYFAARYDGATEWQKYARKGKGERLDLVELTEIIALVESGTFDFVVLEDLGRYLRRMQAFEFCELCDDTETRLIAINDSIDTARSDWCLHAFFASLKHEQSNRDTSLRIKRSKREAFRRGVANRLPIFGYVVPPGAKNLSEWSKNPEAEAIYDEWFTRLEEGQLDEEIADWLNELQIPTGPYCRSDKWTGPMVGRITGNPILKGLPRHNERTTKRKNKTGVYESRKAPADQVIEFAAPHLAFVEPARFDRAQRRRKSRNAKYARKTNKNGTDPLRNRPRRRTPWPGQHTCCGVCQRIFVFGGHGQTERLMCKGARAHACWNGITFDGPMAAKRMSAAILNAVEAWPDYGERLRAGVEEALANFETIGEVARKRLLKLRDKSTRELNKLVQFVREADSYSPRLADEIKASEIELDDVEQQLVRLEREKPNQASAIPPLDEIRQLARDQMSNLAPESWEFAKLMRRLMRRIVVRPYRLFDGTGHPVLRAHFELQLFEISEPAIVLPDAREHLTQQFVVDLFDPPVRIKYREQVMALRQQAHPRLTNREIAKQLGINTTDLIRCANLDRAMKARGLEDPYVLLTSPPENYSKLTRHKHPRYRFKPLEEFEI